jgi:hypothetical protein
MIIKENDSNFNIKFPKSINLIESHFKDFLSILKMERLYIPHKPANRNDWNEELQIKKGFIPEKKKEQPKIEKVKSYGRKF